MTLDINSQEYSISMNLTNETEKKFSVWLCLYGVTEKHQIIAGNTPLLLFFNPVYLVFCEYR